MGAHHSHGSHDHGHDHHHHAPQSFNKAFAISVILALAFTGTEAVYALIANSMGLLADAAHNLGDALGLILAWIANWLMSLPARKRYSYGYKRTTIIASVVNACILIATSALIAYESIYKLFNLTNINETIVVVVGIIGIIINGGSALLFMRGSKEDLNIKGAYLHLLSDMVISAGVVVSAIIIRWTDMVWIDPMVGLIIVLIILWGTWSLLRDSIVLMLDAVPHYIDHHGVKEYLEHLPRVEAVHDLHIWGLSTREVALTAHLIMPQAPLTDAEYKAINQHLHRAFNIDHVTLQVEAGSIDHPCARVEKC